MLVLKGVHEWCSKRLLKLYKMYNSEFLEEAGQNTGKCLLCIFTPVKKVFNRCKNTKKKNIFLI